MAVRDPDIALDKWLDEEITRIEGFINSTILDIKDKALKGESITSGVNNIHHYTGRLVAFTDVRAKLREFWCSDM